MRVNLYKITNIKTGKSYIGKTKRSVGKRFASHCRKARRDLQCRGISSAIRKYGVKAFHIENLGFCLSDKAACIVEKVLITYWRTKCPSYNMTEGGDGLVGYRFTLRQSKNLSQAMRGRPMTWSNKIHATLRTKYDAWRKSISDGMQRMSKEEKAARMKKIWRTRRLHQ